MIYDGVLARLLSIELAEMDTALTRHDEEEGQGAGAQSGGAAGRLRLRQRALRRPARPAARGAHGRDAGADPHRGQRRGRARVPDGWRDGRRLVSDHPILVALRDADRLPAQVPHGSGDRQGHLRRGAGRGRDRGARHGGGGVVGRGAIDDLHVGAGHLADGGVHRPGVLRRVARGDLRRATRRPVHGPADAHRAGRHRLCRRPVARRHEAHPAAARLGQRVLHDGHRGVRPRRAVPDTDFRDDGPRPRHEHVDGRAVSVSRRRRSTAARCSRRRPCRPSASGAGTRTWTATAFRTASLPGSVRTVLLHPRVWPQRQGAVQRADRRLHRQHRPPAAQVQHGAGGSCRSPRSTCAHDAKVGLIAYGTSHWAVVESRDQLRAELGLETSYFRLRAFPFTRDLGAFIDAHDCVYVVEQNRDGADAGPDASGTVRTHGSASCAASVTTTGCRSTPARSPRISARTSRARPCRPRRLPRTPSSGQRRPSSRVYASRSDAAEEGQSHQPRARGLPRGEDDTLRGMRSQRDHRAHHRRVLRDGRRAHARAQALGHRLFEQEPGVLPEHGARVQLRARAHAVGGHRRAAWPTRRCSASA